jgi:hypothetical protein
MYSDKMRKLALLAMLLIPLGLLHLFVLAEICIGLIDILFLAHSTMQRDFRWARKLWFIIAAAWWGWLVICSLPLPLPGWGAAGFDGFIQAVVIIRLLIFAAALQNWLLTTPGARRAAWIMLALATLWIALESWQQYLTGHNIFGNPRWGDGSLTGPFWKPRAGDLYAHLLFVGALPVTMALLARPGRLAKAAGWAIAIIGVITAVLIGQRMCVLFALMGLVVAAFYVRQLRIPMFISLVAAVAVLVATPIISPPTHSKLVGETKMNMTHFSQSPYGQIFTVATDMGLQSPIHGWGYRSFRYLRQEPQFNVGLPALDLPPTQQALGAWNEHAQNFYIQSFADSGFPGLILFTAMMGMFTFIAMRGLWRNPDAVRVGLFIGVLNYTFPLASTDEFPTLYMMGWFFFFVGFSLACADIAPKPPFDKAENV